MSAFFIALIFAPNFTSPQSLASPHPIKLSFEQGCLARVTKKLRFALILFSLIFYL